MGDWNRQSRGDNMEKEEKKAVIIGIGWASLLLFEIVLGAYGLWQVLILAKT